ncbi:MAG: hypothetical protein DRO01_04330 [Thermoproteota archaeon]|nr:MAG: hypothetical protein DRO01_04330 [Candidatus Korarchaeota archaeon]
MDYVTVSAKIPRELGEKLKRFGIEPGPVIRRALEEEVRRAELRMLDERSHRMVERLRNLGDREIADLVREDRDKR